ncbi:unannotated protein [freshwater metagenome]|uniref:Unannotated protein n=1 Tax=freshwater metagenome TaxID=449393 RepID=A0A6J7QGH4_9ZZZZ
MTEPLSDSSESGNLPMSRSSSSKKPISATPLSKGSTPILTPPGRGKLAPLSPVATFTAALVAAATFRSRAPSRPTSKTLAPWLSSIARRVTRGLVGSSIDIVTGIGDVSSPCRAISAAKGPTWSRLIVIDIQFPRSTGEEPTVDRMLTPAGRTTLASRVS